MDALAEVPADVWLSAGALAVSLLWLTLWSYRDLGPMVAGLLLASLQFAGPTTPWLPLGAGVVALWCWQRNARAGLGRADMVGWVVVAYVALAALRGMGPTPAWESVAWAGYGIVVVASSLSAFHHRRPSSRVHFHYRDVPVVSPDEEAS